MFANLLYFKRSRNSKFTRMKDILGVRKPFIRSYKRLQGLSQPSKASHRSCMPSPYAPDPIRVKSFYQAHYPEINPYKSLYRRYQQMEIFTTAETKVSQTAFFNSILIELVQKKGWHDICCFYDF